MGQTVVDGHAYAHHGETNERALFDGLAETLFASRDELARNGPTDDVVDEFHLLHRIAWQRLHVAANAGELTRTTGLLLVGVGELTALGDRLAVGHLRLAGDDFAAILTLHALHVDFEMELAHAADDGLLGLFILMHAEGGVFFGEAVERLGEVLLARAIFGLDRQGNHCCRDVHRGQGDVDLAVGEGLTGGAIDAVEGHDVAGAGALDFLALLGVHTEHARHANLAHLVGAIDDGVAGVHAFPGKCGNR